MSRARNRWQRGLMLLGFAAVAVVAWFRGPDVLRHLDVFRVQQVEVVGTRFLEPYAVVRAAGLGVESSVLDDADEWLAGVRTLRLVDEIRVGRVLPGKIRLEVREVEPVALVDAGTLRPVDAGGRLLDLSPAGLAFDLPIVTGLAVENEVVAAGPSASAVATVAAVMKRAPDVAARLSQAELQGEELTLTFREGRTTAVLPAAATGAELTQLRLALADLLARGELEKVRTIDVRYRDQVVVSFLGTP